MLFTIHHHLSSPVIICEHAAMRKKTKTQIKLHCDSEIISHALILLISELSEFCLSYSEN
jgi:hypothetical protein